VIDHVQHLAPPQQVLLAVRATAAWQVHVTVLPLGVVLMLGGMIDVFSVLSELGMLGELGELGELRVLGMLGGRRMIDVLSVLGELGMLGELGELGELRVLGMLGELDLLGISLPPLGLHGLSLLGLSLLARTVPGGHWRGLPLGAPPLGW
jgi:hypothetical protein